MSLVKLSDRDVFKYFVHLHNNLKYTVEIPKTFKYFKTTDDWLKTCSEIGLFALNNRACYANSLYLIKTAHRNGFPKKLHHLNVIGKGARLCVGMAVAKPWLVELIKNPYTTPETSKTVPHVIYHAWNVSHKHDRILDYTWGMRGMQNYVYIGKVVSISDTFRFKDGICVKQYLWRELGIDLNLGSSGSDPYDPDWYDPHRIVT